VKYYTELGNSEKLYSSETKINVAVLYQDCENSGATPGAPIGGYKYIMDDERHGFKANVMTLYAVMGDFEYKLYCKAPDKLFSKYKSVCESIIDSAHVMVCN
jgi:hypothetical protein